MLFTWGANSYGQLCLGSQEDFLLPKQSEVLPLELEGRIAFMSGGGGHTALLTDDGDVFMAGSNDKGQLGLGEIGKNTAIPRQCSSLLKIRSIACGWSHTLACTGNDSRIFAAGSNSFGQLGLPITGNSTSFAAVEVNSPVTSVAAGMNHTLVITADGNILSTGFSSKGQLGHSKEVKKFEAHFVKVNFGEETGHFVKAAAGGNHSMALTDDGRVFCWGENKHGECGAPSAKTKATPSSGSTCSESVERVHLPLEVQLPCPIVDICCGWSHSFAISVDGKVFGWGRCDYGQLGFEPRSAVGRHTPDLIEFPTDFAVVKVTCGAEHSLALTRNGSLLSWGWNEHGMCGTGNEVNVMQPRIVNCLESRRCSLIGCGAGASFAVCT